MKARLSLAPGVLDVPYRLHPSFQCSREVLIQVGQRDGSHLLPHLIHVIHLARKVQALLKHSMGMCQAILHSPMPLLSERLYFAPHL